MVYRLALSTSVYVIILSIRLMSTVDALEFITNLVIYTISTHLVSLTLSQRQSI